MSSQEAGRPVDLDDLIRLARQHDYRTADDFPSGTPRAAANEALAIVTPERRHRRLESARRAPAVADTAVSDRSPMPPPIVERYNNARIDWSTIWDLDVDADDFLIAPVVAAGRSHALYASAKTGKSLFVLYLVACAATGRPVLDHPAAKPVRTLYIDAEMTPGDVKERLVDMGFGPGDDLSNLAYLSLPMLPPLDTAEGGAHLLALAAEHRAELVVIDTVSRVMEGEENDNGTIQRYYRHTGSRLKAAGIALVRIDHSGKDAERGQRGGSAKNDDVDVVYRLTANDRGRFTLKATHRRMSWVPESLNVQQTADPLGYSRVDDAWPAGTADAARLLDRLRIPIDHGRERAKHAIKDAGEDVPRTGTLAAAIRYRKLGGEPNVVEIDEVGT